MEGFEGKNKELKCDTEVQGKPVNGFGEDLGIVGVADVGVDLWYILDVLMKCHASLQVQTSLVCTLNQI